MRKKIVIIIASAVIWITALTGCSDTRNNLNLKSVNAENETERKTEEQTERQTERKTERQTERQTERKTERQTERQTERKTERQTERQTERKTEQQTEKVTDSGSSVTNKDTFNYYGDGYVIILPNTWTDVTSAFASTMGADSVFVHYGTSQNGYNENISITIQDLSGFNIDLDTYTEISKSQYAAMEGYEVLNIGKDNINGMEVGRAEIDVTQNGINCYCMQIYAVKNEKAYIFTFTSDYEDKDTLMDEVNSIFDSIQID